jgi:hypothetical protein
MIPTPPLPRATSIIRSLILNLKGARLAFFDLVFTLAGLQ